MDTFNKGKTLRCNLTINKPCPREKKNNFKKAVIYMLGYQCIVFLTSPFLKKIQQKMNKRYGKHLSYDVCNIFMVTCVYKNFKEKSAYVDLL